MTTPEFSLAQPEQLVSQTHPPLSDRVLIAIEVALRTAWAELLKDETVRDILRTGGEKQITNILRQRLEQIRVREINPLEFNCMVFERTPLDAEYLNYKSEKTRRPDLVFHLAGRPRPGVTDSLNDGLYVECKIVDRNHGSRRVAQYCNKGLKRFVDGDYGWRMPQGMMCAYVRSPDALPIALQEYFDLAGVPSTLCLSDTNLTECTLTKYRPSIFISSHARPWSFWDGSSPGNVSVQHLWLAIASSRD